MSTLKPTGNAMKRMLAATFCLCFLAGAFATALAAEVSDELARGFAVPPDSARPHTWWHWMNGNITKEGITADLEAMKRVGIGGAQIFNVSERIPEGPVAILSTQWLDLIRHAAVEADRLGMELCFHNCPGWANSGGPWIQPEHGMQTVVISETQAKGPSNFNNYLSQPATKAGYYRDIAALAFPTPSEQVQIDKPNPKTLAGAEYKYGLQPDPKTIPAAAVVARDRIVDLTSSLAADGKLTWDVPAGDWTILRIGHTPTGKTNHPAPKSGTGLECDKLSREALDAHWAGGVEPVLKILGPLAGKSVNNCLIDSYEVGNNNWSPRFRDEFIKRRGYDPVPLLPVLSGRYVESGEVTERFLWDFRRTIGDLFAENYFGYFGDLCRKHGLKFSVEPYEGPFECLQAGAKADIIMGEFWVGESGGVSNSVKLAASVGHTHGIRIIGAESFTARPTDGKWLQHPGSLKMQGDSVWCAGVNRFIFHTYAHQPWMDKVPGMTMGQWGTHFGRFNTWWEQSRDWLAYVARSQFLLQQGRCAADVLFFGGEASPNGNVFRQDLKAKGYDYDAVGTDLMPVLSIKDGLITTPSGGAYRVLVLPDSPWMTPSLARKVRDLVQSGAVVIGPKPQKSPSLSDYPACDAEVGRIADEVWGTTPGEHAFGKGRIIWGGPVEEVLASLGVKPDFAALSSDAHTAYIHRIADAADIYFVSNQKRRPESVDCAFRITGRLPELWDAESGDIQPAPMWRVENGRTIVTLEFEQAGSVFVVFRQAAAAPSDPIVKMAGQGNIPPARPMPKLEIRQAIYGNFSREDGAKVDVTAKLRERVKDGALQMSAFKDLAPDLAPTPKVVYELHVEYAVDGVLQSAEFRDGQELQLPVDVQDPSPPAPRLSLENGQLRLITANAGRYTFTTASGAEKTATIESLPEPVEITGSWELTFPAGRGAPARATFDRLMSWPEHADAGIKYFSGTATYRKTIAIPAACLTADRKLQLDLGKVKEIAEVRLNGQDLGILWKSPFRVDVTHAAKAGDNELEVRVTNLWPNRLIGDEQQPEDCQWNGIALKSWPDWMLKAAPRPVPERVTFTTWKHWIKDAHLLPSGLLGPVELRTLVRIPVK